MEIKVSSSTLHVNRSMTKHQATAVIILREQVTGEWRPDSRGQGVEAKARPCRGQGHDFLSSRCPRGRGQSSRTPSLNSGVVRRATRWYLKYTKL